MREAGVTTSCRERVAPSPPRAANVCEDRSAVAGHLFITRGDLKRLACDAILVPSGTRAGRCGDVTENWTSLDLPIKNGYVTPAPNEKRRVVLASKSRPRAVWVGHTGEDDRGPDWYADAIAAFVHEAGAHGARSRVPRPLDDDRPLLGVPLVGTGQGGMRGRKGEVVQAFVRSILGTLEDVDGDVDVVLVLANREAYAAAQQARARELGGNWIAKRFRRVATELSDRARLGRLVLFMGSGTGIGAGLPDWQELIEQISKRARVRKGAERDELKALDPRDAGDVLNHRLAGRNLRLAEVITQLVDGSQVSLVHQLLASWPVTEAVTTNYDTRFEQAWRDAGRRHVVLPRRSARRSSSWLLKLHGSIDDPDRIVLSREDYLRFEGEGVALAGVVQAMLLTRHMLFVGYSLSDDNFHRLVHQAKAAIGPVRDEREARFGTAITPQKPRLSEELWSEDVEFVSTAGTKEHAVRQLAILLDYIGQEAAVPAAHLLQNTYRAVFSKDELKLRDELRDVVAAARGTNVRPPVRRAVLDAIDGLRGR